MSFPFRVEDFPFGYQRIGPIAHQSQIINITLPCYINRTKHGKKASFITTVKSRACYLGTSFLHLYRKVDRNCAYLHFLDNLIDTRSQY